MKETKAHRKPRVAWTTEEEEAVIENAVEAFFQNREDLWRSFSKGQEILPPERRRTITGVSSVGPKLTDRLTERLDEVLEKMAPYPIQIEVEKIVTIDPPSREEILKEIPTEELLIFLAKRLANLIDIISGIEKIKESIKPAQDQLQPQTENAEKKPEMKRKIEKKKPRVLLVDFLPNQEEIIREKASNFDLELRFWGKKNREDSPQSCNWCIVNMKTSHSTTGRLKKGFTKGKFFLVTGIDATLQRLANIHSVEEARKISK